MASGAAEGAPNPPRAAMGFRHGAGFVADGASNSPAPAVPPPDVRARAGVEIRRLGDGIERKGGDGPKEEHPPPPYRLSLVSAG